MVQMNATRLWLFLVVLTSGSFAVGQQLPRTEPEEVGVSAKQLDEITKFTQSLIGDGEIAGGVTMMTRRGKVVHLSAVGMSDREANRPMLPDTIFRIASMTKPITSVAVMMLWEEGRIRLDDPVSKFIPEFAVDRQVLVSTAPLKTVRAKRDITIHDLLTHTSGLSYYTKDLVPFFPEAKLKYGLSQTEGVLRDYVTDLSKLPLYFHPGEQWRYGPSPVVLGCVVEVVSGQTFDEFLRTRLFEPLKMQDTCFYVPDDKRSRMSAVYSQTPKLGLVRLKDGEKKRIASADYLFNGPRTFFSPDAGLCSTAQDYMRFCLMMLQRGELDGKRLLRPETVKLMTVNQIGDLTTSVDQKFGLGFSVTTQLQEDEPEALRGSYGWGGFFGTNFIISPQENWAIVSMCQRMPSKNGKNLRVNYARLAAKSIVQD